MVTPRRTRLVRASTLPAFQGAIARAVGDADPECAVVVPTRSAAAHLRRTLAAEGAAGPGGASPASVRLLTRDALYRHLHARLASPPRLLADVERETLARAAARDAVRAGAPPPFRLRPGLVRLVLAFHDDLARHGRSVDTFERLAVEDLEPSAAVDRGARRLLGQTRFLVAAFRAFAARLEATGGLDEHRLRALLLAAAAPRPLREVIVTVADRAAQPGGLYPADFDLAARLPALARVTVIATDALLDAGFRERLDDLLPGIEEERAPAPSRPPPVLVAPAVAPDAPAADRADAAVAGGAGVVAPRTEAAVAGGGVVTAPGAGALRAGGRGVDASGAAAGRRHFVWRDREDELRWVARRVVRQVAAAGPPATSGLPGTAGARPAVQPGAALVVQRPLPYLYLASSVAAELGLSFAAYDGLPLATEPFAAAVDLALACVREDFAREPLVALLGSPQLAFGAPGRPGDPAATADLAGSADPAAPADLAGPADRAAASDPAAPGDPAVSGSSVAARDAAVEALDRELEARRFTGGAAPLRELDAEWSASPPRAGSRAAAARPAAAWAVEAATELAPLGAPAPPAQGLGVLLAFLDRHAAGEAVSPDAEASPGAEASAGDKASPGDETAARHEDVRARIRTGLAALRDAAAALGDPEPEIDAAGLADLVRQWIEGQPGPVPAPPAAAVLHLVDAQAAPYGRFDDVYLGGLVDDEWPPRPPRNVFYPAAMLAGLGWPRERARLRSGRAAFRDLLGLARSRVALSAFALEDDAVVTRSVWLDDVPDAGLVRAADAGAVPTGAGAVSAEASTARTVSPEAATARTVSADAGDAPAGAPDARAAPAALPASGDSAAVWRAWRLRRAARLADVVDAGVPGGAMPGPAAPGGAPPDDAAQDGAAPDDAAAGRAARPYAVSALDRYLECPFKYFARHALGLEPDAEDEGSFTPRRRGVFVHRVFEAFFAAWQAAGEGAITLGSVDRALDRFRDVADAEVARLVPADRAVARTWLLGSAAAPGLAERLFMAEVEHPADLVERRLEVRLDGTYAFAGPAGPRRVALRGTADRIDLYADRTFRVLDYKAERPPRAVRSLQLPVYAACAERRLGGGGGRWRAAGADYVAFGDPRLEVPAAAGDVGAAMRAGERRVVEVVGAIEGGAFPPRPADASRCRSCPFPTVCRKDGVAGG